MPLLIRIAHITVDESLFSHDSSSMLARPADEEVKNGWCSGNIMAICRLANIAPLSVEMVQETGQRVIPLIIHEPIF